jgi:Holliday junction resolvase
MRVGQARKRDFVEAGIVATLRQIGVTVVPVSGKGAPDLIAWHPREGVRLIEVKSQTGKLTPAQEDLHEKLPICIVRNVEEALALFNVNA